MNLHAHLPGLPAADAAVLARKYKGFSPQRIFSADSLPPLDVDLFHDTATRLIGIDETDGKSVMVFPIGFSVVDEPGEVGAYSFLHRIILMHLFQMTILGKVVWEALATIPLKTETAPTEKEPAST